MIATENPIEQEGTFPLPEAQLDRFALRSGARLPATRTRRSRSSSRSATAIRSPRSSPAITADELATLQRAVEDVYVDELLLRWTVDLVRATRAVEGVAIGASVRGSLTLERTARAWALLARPRPRRARTTSSGSSCRCSGTGCCSPRRSSRRRARSAATRRSRTIKDALPRARAAAGARLGRLTRCRSRASGARSRSCRGAGSTGLPFGDLPSRRRGHGSDVIGSRPYEPGDPVSTIDWFATARLSAATGRDEFVVRDRAADEAPRVAVVSTAGRRWGSIRRRFPWLAKRAALREAAAAIVASAAAARADLAALDFAGGEAWWLPPGRRDRPWLVAERARCRAVRRARRHGRAGARVARPRPHRLARRHLRLRPLRLSRAAAGGGVARRRHDLTRRMGFLIGLATAPRSPTSGTGIRMRRCSICSM